jgi:hypothetical protein
LNQRRVGELPDPEPVGLGSGGRDQLDVHGIAVEVRRRVAPLDQPVGIQRLHLGVEQGSHSDEAARGQLHVAEVDPHPRRPFDFDRRGKDGRGVVGGICLYAAVHDILQHHLIKWGVERLLRIHRRGRQCDSNQG